MYKCKYGDEMDFEWDENKNALNVHKHGIDFVDVVDMFNHPMLVLVDRYINDEERWIGIGRLKMMVTVVVYTERQSDVIRIISARKAVKREVNYYEQNIKY